MAQQKAQLELNRTGGGIATAGGKREWKRLPWQEDPGEHPQQRAAEQGQAPGSGGTPYPPPQQPLQYDDPTAAFRSYPLEGATMPPEQAAQLSPAGMPQQAASARAAAGLQMSYSPQESPRIAAAFPTEPLSSGPLLSSQQTATGVWSPAAISTPTYSPGLGESPAPKQRQRMIG